MPILLTIVLEKYRRDYLCIVGDGLGLGTGSAGFGVPKGVGDGLGSDGFGDGVTVGEAVGVAEGDGVGFGV